MGRVQILDGGSDSDDEQVPEIKINEEYARRYEHNKEREELHRLEEMKKRGEVSDSEDSEASSTEDEEEFIRGNSKKKNLEFLDGLIKVKTKDPVLKNKDVQLFKADDATQKPRAKGDEGRSEKKKKMYLKDVNARHLMEQGPGLEEEEEKKNAKVYDEDQEKLRKEFLSAAAKEEEEEEEDADADAGELIREKGENAVEDDDDEDVDDDVFVAKLNQCFPEEDENARFLKNYFMNQEWREDKRGAKVADEEEEDLSQDEMEIERQEEYEYRFQENAGDRILGHSRQVEGSVRKKDSARKKQRQSKEERMEIAKAEREEELRHLKNLKKKENSHMLKRIMEIAGIKDDEVASFDPKELEKEFNPQDYDRMMSKAFGREYYQADDADLDFGSDMDEDGGYIEKPDFDKEDELLGLPKGWDSVGSGDAFLAARDKALKLKESVGDHESEEEEEEESEEDEEVKEEEEDGEEGKQERKRKFALLDRAKKEMMDEYYKLDYEDTIEDLKTRFKYAKIKPNRFGLTTSEILVLDEKELNQYVSLKKLAPYADKEWKAPNNKRMEVKEKFKEIAVELGKKGNKKNHKKQRVSVDTKPSSSSTRQSSANAPEPEKEQAGGSNGDTGKKSRGSRRREKKAAQKLLPDRLKSYGLS